MHRQRDPYEAVFYTQCTATILTRVQQRSIRLTGVGTFTATALARIEMLLQPYRKVLLLNVPAILMWIPNVFYIYKRYSILLDQK